LSSASATLSRAPVLRQSCCPGDDVGVVIEPRDDDLVARLHIAPAPGLRDKVYSLRRSADEDSFGEDAWMKRRTLSRAAS
jgi:hypothetical protein